MSKQLISLRKSALGTHNREGNKLQILRIPDEPAHPCVLALGNFDGVHLGHQKLFATGLREAEVRGLPLAVLRFYPHPDKVLFPDRMTKLLSTPEQQRQLFANAGVGILYEMPFTKQTALTEPEEFVKKTIRDLKAVQIVVGFNYSFGAKGKGTPEMLQSFGDHYGFEVRVLNAQVINGQVVSSSRIREALSHGDIKLASRMLGRLPTIIGKVVLGEQRGRTLGFPTANIEPDEDLLIPQRGVYAVNTVFKGQKFNGMMNIGVKPTFHSIPLNVIEVHLFNFNTNIYGERLEINIIQRIRDEQKFSDVKLLQEQLQRDARAAQTLSTLF